MPGAISISQYESDAIIWPILLQLKTDCAQPACSASRQLLKYRVNGKAHTEQRQRGSTLIHEIVIFGNEALRRKSKPVMEISPAIRQLVQDMMETMRDARGVGLAAEQIGHEEAICVIDVPREAEKPECVETNSAVGMPLVLINPEITASEGKQRCDEGCLSFPDIVVPITRAQQVTASYTDLDGARHTVTVQGLLARAVQHELDHLEGVLLVDRMSAVQRISVAGRLKRLRRAAAQ